MREGFGTTFLRRRISFIEGSNVTISVSDDAGSEEVDVTISASSSGPTAGDGIDVSGTQVSADVSDFAGGGLEDDGANNLRRQALTNEVTASAGSNSCTVTRSTNFAWTGQHAFSTRFSLTGVTSVGAGNNVSIGNANVVNFTSGSTLTGMVPAGTGHKVLMVNSTGSTITVQPNTTSSASNQIDGAGNMSFFDGQLAAGWYNGSRWIITLRPDAV